MSGSLSSDTTAPKFYKIDRERFNGYSNYHHGFQYREGLNVDDGRDRTEKPRFSPGGLYFRDESVPSHFYLGENKFSASTDESAKSANTGNLKNKLKQKLREKAEQRKGNG